MAEVTIRYLRQVNNMLTSVRTEEELVALGEEVHNLMNKFNLPLQIKYSTIKEVHPNWEADIPQETLLGYRWDKITDQIIPNIELTRDNKGRGLKGDLIKNKPFHIKEMTKRRLLAILSSLFDPLGTFFSPLRLTLKALYSAVCIEIPGRTREAFDTPLTCISADLARITTELCNSLTRLELLKPMRRNVIPKGSEVSFLVATKDGSSTGYSATLHVTSKENQTEKFECRIARAISRVKIASAATTELMG